MERRLAYAIASLPLADPPIRCIVLDTPPGLGVRFGVAYSEIEEISRKRKLINTPCFGVRTPTLPKMCWS